MLPMDLHSKKPFRHRARLKKMVECSLFVCVPWEGRRTTSSDASGEAGSEQEWSVMDFQESIQAQSPPSKREKNPGRL